MSTRGRGHPPYRGRGGRGGRIIAQMGNQRLIAENIANIASSSSSNTLKDNNDTLFKEFLEYKARQGQGNSQNNPSYAKVVNEDESDSDDLPFIQNNHKELILLLEDRDLKWKDEIWHLMSRYLDNASFTAGSYKQRIHFENILKATSSCEFSHFFPGTNKKAYSFSKVIIKQIISAEDWGISTLKEREYYLPDQKVSIKFNYWDYVEAFNKAFLYQNPMKKHTWFFKFCQNIYKKEIPNWLYQWWLSYGPSIKILPESYQGLYTEWVKISPKLIEADHNDKWIEGMPSLHFFIEFGIPWIWKWEPEMGHTQHHIPCLQRTFYTKFWKRMLRNNEHGVLEGQSTIDDIQDKIAQYKEQIKLHQQRESPSPFRHIARKLNLQKGHMTKEEIIASYMEEVKKDLFKNFCELQPDISMATSSHEDDHCIPGESQDPYADEADVSIDTMIQNIEQEVTEQIIGSKKDKGKATLNN